MSELRCKPGDLCVVVPGPDEAANKVLAPAIGRFVTVTETCPGTPRGWHYQDPQLAIQLDSRVVVFHAIPDENLQPIRPSAPSKETDTWSPKKQHQLV